MVRVPVAFSVQICDGCCCGTTAKHPGIDHARIRSELIEAAEFGGGRARVVGCLDQCRRSNVVVVRRRGRPLIWLGGVLEPGTVGALSRWLRATAADPLPPSLACLTFDPRHPNGSAVDRSVTLVHLGRAEQPER